MHKEYTNHPKQWAPSSSNGRTLLRIKHLQNTIDNYRESTIKNKETNCLQWNRWVDQAKETNRQTDRQAEGQTDRTWSVRQIRRKSMMVRELSDSVAGQRG